VLFWKCHFVYFFLISYCTGAQPKLWFHPKENFISQSSQRNETSSTAWDQTPWKFNGNQIIININRFVPIFLLIADAPSIIQ
jgi:hypothetical protein